MVRESWFEDNMKSSEFYFRSALRHRYFVLNAATLTLVILMLLLILIKAWSHLSFFAVWYLLLALASILGLWRGAIRTHFNLRLIFSTGQAEKPPKDTPLSLALLTAGYMTNLGLMLAMWAVAFSLMAMSELIPKR